MFQRSLLKDSDVEPLAQGVYETLEKVGVLCQNAELLKALAGWGAEVDATAERARFPRTLVRAQVEAFHKEAAPGVDIGHRRYEAPPLPSVGIRSRSSSMIGRSASGAAATGPTSSTW